MARLRPVDFDDRLSLVEHLDELRSRIVTTLVAFGVVFGICAWQNHFLLKIVNRPLPEDIPGFAGATTFGVAEPFTTTLTVSAYMAIVITLPLIVYQVYSFVLPALSPRERGTVTPFVVMAPFLFIGGVVFAYFVVVPAALDFLLNFNSDEFNTQLRAREYYGFFAQTEVAVGLLFQLPIGILAVIKLGIVTPKQLAANRRYAILVIAVVAMLLPGTDPITMLLSMAPLVLLFEGSLLFARLAWRVSPPDPDLVAEADSEDEPAGK